MGKNLKDGIINVYKPAGMTSNDVIYKMRSILGIKKIGHTGTLDPMATGVLPICINRSTRVAEYLDVDFKTYKATMRLGVITSTLDMTGEVEELRDTSQVSAADIIAALESQVGLIEQLPPLISAIRINGRRLYEFIHAGEKIPPEVAEKIVPRKVLIKSLTIDGIKMGDGMLCHENALSSKPLVSFTVTCSKGTYIRSIARDAGEILGCGASLETLERTASGVFTKENAVSLDELLEIAVHEGLIELMNDAAKNNFDVSVQLYGNNTEENLTAQTNGIADFEVDSKTDSKDEKGTGGSYENEFELSAEDRPGTENTRPKMPAEYMIKRLKRFDEDIPEVFRKFVFGTDYPLTHFGKAIVSPELARKFIDGWHLGYNEIQIVESPEFSSFLREPETTGDTKKICGASRAHKTFDGKESIKNEKIYGADGENVRQVNIEKRADSYMAVPENTGSYPGIGIRPEYAGMYKIYSKDGTFIGIAKHSDKYKKLVCDKIFCRI